MPQLLCSVQVGEWGGGSGSAGGTTRQSKQFRSARGVVSSRRAGQVFAGVVAMGIGFTLRLDAEPSSLAAFGMIHSTSLDFPSPLGPQIPKSPRVRLASLDMEAVSESDIEDKELQSDLADFGWGGASFNRLFFDPRLASFEERFVGAARFDERFAAGITPDSRSTADVEEPDGVVLPADTGEHARARQAAGQSAPHTAPASSQRAAASKKRLAALETHNESSSPSDPDPHTAIYDISSHTVYLPNGRRLEAHSGFGSYMDDVRYVSAKARGPTPPNVYVLSMREQLFHGVRAIRLTPVGDGNMFGRAGILAHPYMLGPSGQSNGCVSLSDYPSFLDAFSNGEIDRLVVVEHLDSPPEPKTASGWLADRIKAFFIRS